MDILIVDDEPDICLLIADLLKERGMVSRSAESADQALSLIRERHPRLIILDIWLRDGRLDGLTLLSKIKAKYGDIPVIVISGHATVEKAVEAIRLGAYHFIEKPIQSETLLLTVERALEMAHLTREHAELRQLYNGPEPKLIGQSSAIKHLGGAIDKIAASKSRVMIFGPPGAGKGLVARLIHSKNSYAPFVEINCAAFENAQIAQELFGVESFSRKRAALEKADGGILFLDEVGDLPKPIQDALLKFLHTRQFIPIGGNESLNAQVRLLCSTSKNMQVEIEARRFRQDLFDRLNVVRVQVPSVAERRQDIPFLLDYFMQDHARRMGTSPLEFDQDALTLLQKYSWPGNVRQLKNLIEWLLIMYPSGPIQVSMLPQEIQSTTPLTVHLENKMMEIPLREAREIFEREYLSLQIIRFNGSISRAAAFVGMERSALYRKLKALGVKGFS